MFSLLDEHADCLIVFDLEWNQSGYASNHRIPHEIIEIGACRVDRRYRVVDTFSAMICPRVYKKLDKHIRSVTGITEEELHSGRPFSDVFGEFIAWCGNDASLCTWGRDDYPVLRRNAAFFMTPMPFDPPIDAQLVFGHACLHSAGRQMNLHAALDEMNISIEVPAHRAVYDAQCTAALLKTIDDAVAVLNADERTRLLAVLDRERRIAASVLRSVPTRHTYQSDALADEKLVHIACPACGKRTTFDTLWFDGGRDKYLALAFCPQHGMACGHMHFKRTPAGSLIMHQRIFAASAEEIEHVREQYRLFELIPPKKRHHRLSMQDVLQQKQCADSH